MLGNQDTAQAEAYFSRPGTDLVAVSKGDYGPAPETTAELLRQMNTRIRWKNSPDGTPARIKSQEQILADGEYTRGVVHHNGWDYEYYTRIPTGTSSKRLPVVISMHGHGEPAWMFAQKNGWPELQEETKGFVFVSPSSPENTWLVERDEGMLEKMLDQMEKDLEIDRTRVYLTGFSNGAAATCWYGTRHPQLFAALSPWNSPFSTFEAQLKEDGWEMPMFAVNGDLDHKMDKARKGYPKLFANFIALNGGTPRPAEPPQPWLWRSDAIWNGENHYTADCGYTQGERLTTWGFQNDRGEIRFCYTDVKNMPHGAIPDLARAAWAFLKHFSRLPGEKQVHYDPQA